MYKPNKWVVLRINQIKTCHYRVFGTWSGGYLDGDSWRLNSGIFKCLKEEDRFLFYGNSGSIYSCYEEMYGVAGASNFYKLEQIKKDFNAEVMPEETDWLNLNYEEPNETS